LVNFVRVIIMNTAEGTGVNVATLGWSVSLALWVTIVLAKLVGCTLPLLAKRLRLDPAVMSAPVITTVVDACALMVFFGIAMVAFNI